MTNWERLYTRNLFKFEIVTITTIIFVSAVFFLNKIICYKNSLNLIAICLFLIKLKNFHFALVFFYLFYLYLSAKGEMGTLKKGCSLKHTWYWGKALWNHYRGWKFKWSLCRNVADNFFCHYGWSSYLQSAFPEYIVFWNDHSRHLNKLRQSSKAQNKQVNNPSLQIWVYFFFK